jgi:maleate isomerase
MDNSIFNEEMYGSRAKIGLIYIASSWVMEPEFYAMSPDGVITCTTRVALPGDVSVDSEEQVGERAIVAAGILGEAPLDVITLGCTSASFVKGEAYEKELVRKMQEASGGIPCTTTTSAVMKGLEAFGAKKIAVMTPYVDELNDKAKEFLTGKGYTVTNFTGMGLIKDHDIDNVTLETIYDAAKAVDTPDAAAIFIACTAFKSIPIIEALEKELKKPVISSIQATFWEAMRMSGVEDKIEGYGSLFKY